MINEADAERLLNWPAVIEACSEALRSVCEEKGDDSQPTAQLPIRTFVDMTNLKGNRAFNAFSTFPSYNSKCYVVGLGFSMLGFIENYRMKSLDPDKVFTTLGHKLVTVFYNNKDLEKPLPVIISSICLFSTCTGAMKTIIEGNGVTAWRTAGSCIVATKYLYFNRHEQDKGSKTLAILGCGVQVTIGKSWKNLLTKRCNFPMVFPSFREESMPSDSVQCSV